MKIKNILFILFLNLFLFINKQDVYAIISDGHPNPECEIHKISEEAIRNYPVDFSKFVSFSTDSMTLYENELGCLFSLANFENRASFGPNDSRFIEVSATFSGHDWVPSHALEHRKAGDKHECNGSTHASLGGRGISVISSVTTDCSMIPSCRGDLCTSTFKFYPSCEVTITYSNYAPLIMIESTLEKLAYGGSPPISTFEGTWKYPHKFIYPLGDNWAQWNNSDTTLTRKWLYIKATNTFYEFIDNLISQVNDSGSGGNVNYDESEDDWDDDDWDNDDDDDDDGDVGDDENLSKQELENRAAGATAMTSNGTIDSSLVKMTVDGDWYILKSDWPWETRPYKLWVDAGGSWWFIKNSQGKTMTLTDDDNPFTTDEKTDVWLITSWAEDEALLINGGGGYRLYEFNSEGYLEEGQENGLGGAIFTKGGKVKEMPGG